jgi:hypothetical protein
VLRWIAAGMIASFPSAAAACPWGFPVGEQADSPAPLADNHPVGGMNLPEYGTHLGGDYWSGGGCTDLGQPVYAVADGVVVEIVDDIGSYLDVVVIEHDDPDAGLVYSMYGHIARDPALVEGQAVALRQPIGTIADVLAYFSPCHLHFELLTEVAFDEGPFCNGCEAAGYHVSPGYDRQVGVEAGFGPGGDAWLEVVDAIDGNAWYLTDAFITARLDARCASCGDGVCDPEEACPSDCDVGESSSSSSDAGEASSAEVGEASSADVGSTQATTTSTTSASATDDAASSLLTGIPALPDGARGTSPDACACTTSSNDRVLVLVWLLLIGPRRVDRRRRAPLTSMDAQDRHVRSGAARRLRLGRRRRSM